MGNATLRAYRSHQAQMTALEPGTMLNNFISVYLFFFFILYSQAKKKIDFLSVYVFFVYHTR